MIYLLIFVVNMGKDRIIIGTRGSALALWQTNWVKSALEAVHSQLAVELKVINTKGDKILDVALSKIGDKGLFTKELEVQLLDGAVDLAVHSLKDLPTKLPDGLHIETITERADVADVLVSKEGLTLDTLPDGAKVFTGSLRRQCLLLQHRKDLEVCDIRGNVQTRLKKFDESDALAMVMAGAGLKRLELDDRISCRLDPRKFLPACGQGALAIEIRDDNARTAGLLAPLDNARSRLTVTAERTVLKDLEGGCQAPIGAHAWITDNKLHLRGMVGSLDGRRVVISEACSVSDQAEQLGNQVAGDILANGGSKILGEIFEAE